MDPISIVLSSIFSQISFFSTLLIIISLCYYFLFRKYIYAFFDPILLFLISLSFGTTGIVFMYSMEFISDYFFIHYMVTQFLFIIGFISFKPIGKKRQYSNLTLTENAAQTTYLYIYTSILFVILQVIIYGIDGIPLFMESRLEALRGGFGAGLLGRILEVSKTVAIFVLVHRYNKLKQPKGIARIYDVLFISFLIATSVLSGAKSTFIELVFIAFYYILFFEHKIGTNVYLIRLRKLQYTLVCSAFIAAVFVSFFELNQVFGKAARDPLLHIFIRFIQSGDAFMLAYVDNALSHMEYANPLIVMFSDFLGSFRLMSWDELPQSLGYQLYSYNLNSDVIKGPNPVLNVFSLFYFGYAGSMIYSLLIGVLCGFIRNKVINYIPPSLTGGLMFMLVVLPSLGLYGDVTLTLAFYNNIAISFLVVIAIPYVLSSAVKSKANARNPSGIV